MKMDDGQVGKAAFWTGWVLGLLPAAMMVMGGVSSLMGSAQAVEGLAKYGYPASSRVPLAVVQLACVVLYLVPQTAVLGAILLTGYLGGAVATHVRAGEASFVMAVVIGILFWLGLYLRDRRIRALTPLRS